jgi:hypothetical protein
VISKQGIRFVLGKKKPKTNQLMLAASSDIHIKHTNTLCGQNAEFVNVAPGGIYSNHWALKG